MFVELESHFRCDLVRILSVWLFRERKNKSNIINAAHGDPEGRPVAQSGWFDHFSLTFDPCSLKTRISKKYIFSICDKFLTSFDRLPPTLAGEPAVKNN